MRFASFALSVLVSMMTVAAFGQANTSLSNLSSTAVNADILPGTTDAINLGNSSFEYLGLYSQCGQFYQGGSSGPVTIGSCAPDGQTIGTQAVWDLTGSSVLKLSGGHTWPVQLISRQGLLVQSGLNGILQIQSGDDGSGVGEDLVLQSGSSKNGTIYTAGHFSSNRSGGISPSSVSCTANAGSTANCYLNGATDTAGMLTIEVNGTGIAAGDQVTITYTNSFPGDGAICTLTPANANATTVQAYVDIVTNNSTELLVAFASAPTAGLVYKYNYFCMASN